MQTVTNKDIIRRVILRPYLKGMGPSFTLTLWDCHKPYRGGPQWQVGYRLTMRQGRKCTVLFYGEDYGCSPLHSIDSDACVSTILGFLTLRPGDTDSEYFEGYTQTQLDYCSHHAEALSCESTNRFGEG